MYMWFLYTCSPEENSTNSHVFIYQLSGIKNLTHRLQTRPLQLAFTPLRNVSVQYVLITVCMIIHSTEKGEYCCSRNYYSLTSNLLSFPFVGFQPYLCLLGLQY